MFGIEYFPFSDALISSNGEADAAIGDFMVVMGLLLVLVELIFFIAITLVPIETGRNPRDPFKRKVFFYSTLGLIAILGFVCALGTTGMFDKTRYSEDFYTMLAWYLPLLLGIFFFFNFLIGKFLAPSSKLGSIFGGSNR